MAAFYQSGLTSVVIPGSVPDIGSLAFSSCFGMTDVVISEGVTSIVSNAFSECYDLTSVVIPESVKRIDVGAFSNCYSLNVINFNGTVKQWTEVSIFDFNLGIGNGRQEREVVCSDGTVIAIL